MRKTNKGLQKLVNDKKGVILVTVIFIAAMALIFITTALTISVATRDRVYSNAQYDQARLTVTSLSQTIWQAIYSQQISDAELMDLAKGNSGQGTYVRFTNANIPGMGDASSDTESSAYFYTMEYNAISNEPSKIGIECKCRIGSYTQYYTLVLMRNMGEGTPKPMFNMTVELGDGGLLNRVNFGIDASKVVDNSADNQLQYRRNGAGETITDNVMFIHGNTTSDTAASGFYCNLISVGDLYSRDSVFTDNAYFIGQDASFNFTSTNQLGEPQRDTGRGDIYFWGSASPFTGANTSTDMPSFRNIYFAYRDIDGDLNRDTTGFNAAGLSQGSVSMWSYYMLQDYNDWGNTGSVYYEAADSSKGDSNTYFGVTYNGTVYQPGGEHWSLNNQPDNWIDTPLTNRSLSTTLNSFTEDYLDIPDSRVDTTGEVQDPTVGYGSYQYRVDNHLAMTEFKAGDTSLSSGFYYFGGGVISNQVICDISGGPITIYVRGNMEIASDSANPAGFIINDESATLNNYVNFVLEGSSTVLVTNVNGGYSGFVDRRCYNSASNYTSYTNLNQNNFPRFFIFSTYTGGTALTMGSGGGGYSVGVVCTAFLGFYPSTQGGNNGANLKIDKADGTLYYGRLAASGIDNASSSGGNLNIPYCPGVPGTIDSRNEAYRDLTDFSVITEECYYSN